MYITELYKHSKTMSTLNYTLLDAQKVQPVVSALRQLLADVQVYYTNLRDFHWNVQGTNFYNLHVEFENLYNGIATRPTTSQNASSNSAKRPNTATANTSKFRR